MAPEQEEQIIKQCEARNIALPQKIQNKPELMLGLELYYGAFFDLNTCRQIGMAMSPISWLHIREYASTFGFDEDQEDRLYFFVRQMDKAFLEHHDKKSSKESSSPAARKLSGKFK